MEQQAPVANATGENFVYSFEIDDAPQWPQKVRCGPQCYQYRFEDGQPVF
jgi:hypothetical protein